MTGLTLSITMTTLPTKVERNVVKKQINSVEKKNLLLHFKARRLALQNHRNGVRG